MYNSQWKQDEWLNEHYFKNKRNGMFVEVGSSDGVTINNTLFFEKHLGWKGICMEPIPNQFDKLRKNRSCMCIEGCAYHKNGTVKFNLLEGYTQDLSGITASYPEKHLQRIDREMKTMGGERKEIDVATYRLDKLFKDNNIKHIDYLSIDTEGSELQVLQGIDFDEVVIDAISVEENYEELSGPVRKLLEDNGFKCVVVLGGDLIYINSYI